MIIIRNILGIFPRKFGKNELQTKLAFWLSIALLILLCYNIFNSGQLEQRIIFLQLDAAIKDIGDDTNAKLTQFEKAPFCGWQLKGTPSKQSRNFTTDQINIEKSVNGNDLNICVLEISKTSQIIFCIVIYAILFFIVYRKFPQKTDKNEEIPDSTEG